MHPEFTEEQVALQASVEKFWRAQISLEKLLAWEKEPAGIDASAWRSIAELGWFGIGVPSDRGGSGLGLVEVACVLEECARGLLPRRVSEAVRGAVALAQLDPQAAELEALARGEQRLTLAIDERAARRPENYSTSFRATPAGPRIVGEKFCVLDPTADWHLVAAADGSGTAIALVAGENARCASVRSFDGSEQAVVTYDGIAAHRIVARGSDGRAKLGAIERTQTALALAEMIGGMTAALDATIAYVVEREQFGQKLAVFQAVQHQVADMALVLTASRHLAWRAISRLAYGTEQGVELATAAAFVSRSFKDVTVAAHHLHGGAGYILEHPLHFHSERAQALAIRYAAEADALEAVAAELLD